MTRHKRGWFALAARAHEALVQYHCLLTDQARKDASHAEQRSRTAAQAVAAVSADWVARRQHAGLDPALDLAYAAYHRQLSQQAAGIRDQHRLAEAQVDHATAELKAAHGMSQVLAELLIRREREQAVTAGKQDLQVVTEAWILTRQHQRKGVGE